MCVCVCVCACMHLCVKTVYAFSVKLTSAVMSFCQRDSPSSLLFAFRASPNFSAVASVKPLVPISKVTSVRLLSRASSK